MTEQCSDITCMKSIHIQGLSGPHSATFWVNTGTYSVSLQIQSKCGKNSHQNKAPNTDTFYTVVRFCSS